MTVADVLTFEAVAEDVLQDRDEVEKLWRRVIQRFRVGAVQQSLHGKPAHGEQLQYKSRDQMVRQLAKIQCTQMDLLKIKALFETENNLHKRLSHIRCSLNLRLRGKQKQRKKIKAMQN